MPGCLPRFRRVSARTSGSGMHLHQLCLVCADLNSHPYRLSYACSLVLIMPMRASSIDDINPSPLPKCENMLGVFASFEQ